MANFHETAMGKRFFESTIPRIARSLEQLAETLPKSHAPSPQPGSELDELRKRVTQDLSDLGSPTNRTKGDVGRAAVNLLAHTDGTTFEALKAGNKQDFLDSIFDVVSDILHCAHQDAGCSVEDISDLSGRAFRNFEAEVEAEG